MRKVQLLRGRLRWEIWTLVLSVVLCTGSPVQASQLTAPGLAASDGMVVGNAVAYPFNAATALFHNPAQLSLVPNSFSTGAFNIMFHPSYENRQGIFNQLPDPARRSPGISTGRRPPRVLRQHQPRIPHSAELRLSDRPVCAFLPSVSVCMGSLGFAFNYGAEPEHGVPNNFLYRVGSGVAGAVPCPIRWRPTCTSAVSLQSDLWAAEDEIAHPRSVGLISMCAGRACFGTIGVMYQPTEPAQPGADV